LDRLVQGGARQAALRNVEIPDIPLQRFAQASQQVKNALNDIISQHWRQSYELQSLLSEILAEDREKAVAFREHALSKEESAEDLVNTRLKKIVECWNRHFPNRKIRIDYEPKVQRTIGSEKIEYPIHVCGPHWLGISRFYPGFSGQELLLLGGSKTDMAPDAVVRIMCQALKTTDKEAAENKKLAELRDAIVTALTPFMWSRKAP
jgi:hypothetical protein